MNKPALTSSIRKLFQSRPKLAHVLVALLYLFCTFYYMGPSFFDCNNTLYGFGDNTAGPIWRNGVSPGSPLWGYETVSNYPVGENLYSPVNYSASLQYTLYWGLAKVAGPVCGYNLVNILGFVSSALIMYGFIYALTRRRSIAVLAGFAASFSPYYQMKVGGHPGYGFQALLIGIVWAFYNLIKKQRRRDAFYLAIITAICFYFDPYFSLLALVSLIPLCIVWALFAWRSARINPRIKATITKQFKLLLLTGACVLALLAPLVAVTVKNSNYISASVAAMRGDVLFEAKACSNLPHEYVLPFVLHPIFGRIAGDEHYKKLIDNLHNGFSCGIGEDTVGVSLVVVTVTGIGLIILLWEFINKRRIGIKLSYSKRLVIIGLLAVGLAGLIMGLPPAKVAGVPTPAYLLLMITSTWRTLTRFYVIVNFASIALFSVILLYFSEHFRKYSKALKAIFAILFFLIFIEYQAFRPFAGNSLSSFSYKKDVPSAYNWLSDQQGIDEVAEYPLERAGGESNAAAYYFSMQRIHQKKLFNANDPTVYEEFLKSSLKDISDPQTLDVLYSIGIDAVIIHGVPEENIKEIHGLDIVYSAPQSTFNLLAFTPLVQNDNIVIARIRERPKVMHMMVLQEGFVRNATIIKSATEWAYEALNNSIIKVVPIPGLTDLETTNSLYCFAVSLAGDGVAELQLVVDGNNLILFEIGSEYKKIQVRASESIQLTNSKGFNMRIKDLGCEAK